MGEPVVRNPFTLNDDAADAVSRLQRSIFAFALSETQWIHTHVAKVRESKHVSSSAPSATLQNHTPPPHGAEQDP